MLKGEGKLQDLVKKSSLYLTGKATSHITPEAPWLGEEVFLMQEGVMQSLPSEQFREAAERANSSS